MESRRREKVEGIKKIGEKAWKFEKGPGLSSFVYFIDYGTPTLIDLGYYKNHKLLLKRLGSIGYSAKDIKRVIFTHFHYDHAGKPSDFKNAKFFASKDEIKDLDRMGYFCVFDRKSLKELRNVENDGKMKPVENLRDKFLKVIRTPGHTNGSICLWLEKEGILFTGDTLFKKGIIGRTDLPCSSPEKIEKSLEKLRKIKYRLLCPGH